MKLALVSVVKNEADIIESFVRHNLEYADYLFILDNHSNDNTPLILQHLQNEGLNLILYKNDILGHRQQELTHLLIQEVIHLTDAEVIMSIDADEFITLHPKYFSQYTNIETRKSLFSAYLAMISEKRFCALKWLTYLPTQHHKTAIKSFTYFTEYLGHHISHEVYKVIFHRDMFQTHKNIQGNHTLQSRQTQSLEECSTLEHFYLAHFPIRNAQQAIAKILITTLTLDTRNIPKGESFHIYDLKEKLIQQNFHISEEQLFHFAYYYGMPLHMHNQLQLNESSPINPELLLKYEHLIDLDIAKKLYFFGQELVKQIRNVNIN